MIRAAHAAWARAIFVPVIEGLLRSRFSRFYCANLPPDIDPSAPLLLTPNHFSWWDGFFFFHLLRKSFLRPRKPQLMMLESQLRKYWYFRHLGAFSIDPGRRSSLDSIRHASALLEDPANVVVVYPQGEIQSYGTRPVSLRTGVRSILKGARPDAVALPLFFRVEYWDTMKPEIWCGFGTPWLGDDAAGSFSTYGADFNRGLAEFDRCVERRSSVAELFTGRL